MSFERALEFVLGEEGGYINDPRDAGGETNFGISKRAHPHLDIKNLTRDSAAEIYRKDYWEQCACDDFPFAVALILFDSAVNQGAPSAIRMLQRACKVKDDGIVGSDTINAAKRLQLSDFIAERAVRYANHPQIKLYGLGWFRRLARCHAAALGAK